MWKVGILPVAFLVPTIAFGQAATYAKYGKSIMVTDQGVAYARNQLLSEVSIMGRDTAFAKLRDRSLMSASLLVQARLA